jgi:hypothetical protein
MCSYLFYNHKTSLHLTALLVAARGVCFAVSIKAQLWKNTSICQYATLTVVTDDG